MVVNHKHSNHSKLTTHHLYLVIPMCKSYVEAAHFIYHHWIFHHNTLITTAAALWLILLSIKWWKVTVNRFLISVMHLAAKYLLPVKVKAKMCKMNTCGTLSLSWGVSDMNSRKLL